MRASRCIDNIFKPSAVGAQYLQMPSLSLLEASMRGSSAPASSCESPSFHLRLYMSHQVCTPFHLSLGRAPEEPPAFIRQELIRTDLIWLFSCDGARAKVFIHHINQLLYSLNTVHSCLHSYSSLNIISFIWCGEVSFKLKCKFLRKFNGETEQTVHYIHHLIGLLQSDQLSWLTESL